MNRTLDVVRLHLINLREVVVIPWAVVGGSFAVLLAVAAAMRWAGLDATPANGAITSLLVAVAVAFGSAATQQFSLAVGFGFSRRAYLAGTVILAAAISVFYGGVVWVLGMLERSSDGWWIGAPFFRPSILPEGNAATLLCVVATMLLATTSGLFLGGLYRRWRAPGFYVTALTALLVLGLIAAWITRIHAWGTVWNWVADSPRLLMLGMIPAVGALVALVGAVALLRHAEP